MPRQANPEVGGRTAGQDPTHLDFPATTYPTGAIYVQGMFTSSNPGYGPAAFSNLLRL